MASAKKKKPSLRKKTRMKKGAKAPISREAVTTAAPRKTQGVPYFLLGSLALTVAGLFSLPNFHLLLPKESFFFQVLVHPSLLLLGFIGFVLAFYRMPEAEACSEMPKWQAYPLFAFLFGLCFFWRFYHPLEPSAPFWFDNQVVTGDIANIIDSGEHVLLFPWGQREPFFPLPHRAFVGVSASCRRGLDRSVQLHGH